MSKQSNDILIAEKKVVKQQYSNTIERQNSKLHIVITVSILLVCIAGVIYVKLKSNQRKTRTIEQKQALLEKEQQEFNRSIGNLKIKLNQKETEDYLPAKRN